MSLDGKCLETVRAEPGEHGKHLGTLTDGDLAGAQFDRQNGREFGCHPVANRKIVYVLRGQPDLRGSCRGLFDQCRYAEGRFEIEAQYRASSRNWTMVKIEPRGAAGIVAISA